MSFTINKLDGYETGKRYVGKLKLIYTFGTARQKTLVLQDENGVGLLWTTTIYSGAYKNFIDEATYKFTVSYILNMNKMGIPKIQIRNLSLDKTMLKE